MCGDKKNKGIKLLNIVNKILNFALKEQKQRGQGLRILTLSQMLCRLPISLGQLKAGNNSEKLKNKISQLLYSLYRSKKLTSKLASKQINLISKTQTKSGFSQFEHLLHLEKHQVIIQQQ